MSSELEERIVAMYFDNKDFEKHAKETINTLGELKDNLNLEESVKGFEELNKAGKTLSLDSARNTVQRLKDSLGGLGNIFKEALTIGSAPLNAMENFFHTFNGYVTKVAGIDIAGKLVSSFENGFHQLTTAPVEAGFNMYQSITDSTKTIMSGTMSSYQKKMKEKNPNWEYDEREHLEFVSGQVKELSTYAEKTVFSLQDMTSNVGKFTNNNVDLETSVTAMKGIANMTAKAGQGAQQASMAMYNFSQAIGVGKMTTIDWKSIENANIATIELKELFIDTAAAAGKLHKEITKTADGKEVKKFFITVDKNGKKLNKKKWIEVNAENFRDSLQHGWLDKETMLKVFQLYSGGVADIDTLAAWGFDVNDKELMEKLMGIGKSAEKAATEVRTFQKMWEALTESVQSGWSDSMTLIFGDIIEATEFWSTINDKLGSILGDAAKRRNDILQEWRGRTFNEETGEWEKLEGAVDGREDLVQGIYGVIDAARNLGAAFTAAWKDVFGEVTGKKLQEITKGFRDFVDKFNAWLGDMKDSNSRISKIRKGLSGIFSVLRVVANVLKVIFGVVLKTAKPLIDPILNLFDKFGKVLDLKGAKNLGEILSTLGNRFTGLWNRLSSLGWNGVLSKIGNGLSELWVKIRDGISNFLDENGLSDVKDWFVGIGDKIKEGYETVKAWWEGSGIPEFFQGIWDKITGIFKGRSKSDFIPKGYNGNVDLLNRPKVKIEAITEAEWVDEEGKPLGGDYATVLTNTFSVGDKKKGFDFSYNENAVINVTPILADGKVLSPKALEKYMEEITAEAKRTGKTIKEVDAERYGIILSYDLVPDDMSLDEAYKKAGEWAEKLHELQEQWDEAGRTEEEAPIVKFFNDTWGSLRDTFTDIMSWPIWGQISAFFSNLWTKLTGIFTPKTMYDDKGFELSEKGNSPFVQFFLDTWEGIKNAYETVRGWPVWGQIGTFFSNLWSKLTEIFQPKLVDIQYDSTGRHEHYGNSPFVQFFVDTWEGIKNAYEEVKSWPIWGQISAFFSNLWTKLTGIFTPQTRYDDRGFELNEKGNSPFVQFFLDTWEGIKNAYEEVKSWPIWGQIGAFFSNLWNKISGIFQPKLVDIQYDSTGRHEYYGNSPFAQFFIDTWEGIKNAYEEVKSWPIWGEIGSFFSGIFAPIVQFFNQGDEAVEAASESSDNLAKKASVNEGSEEATEKKMSFLERIIGALTSFFTNILEKIQGIVIPEGVSDFLKNMGDFLKGALKFLSEVLGTIGRLLSGDASDSEKTTAMVVGAILTVITILGTYFTNKISKNLSEIKTESFAKKFFELGAGLLMIAGAVALLSTIKTEDLTKGLVAVAVIGVVVGAIIALLNKRTGLQNDANANAIPEKPMERVAKNLIGAIEKVGMIAVALALLPGVIKAFGEAKKLAPELKGDDIMKMLLGLAGFIAGVSLTLAAVSKITGNAGIDPMAAMKAALAVVGFISIFFAAILGTGGLLELVQGIVGDKGDVVKAIRGALDKVSAMFEGIGEAIGSFFHGLFSGAKNGSNINKQAVLDENIKMIEGFSEKLDAKTISGLLRVVSLVEHLTKTSESVDPEKFKGFTDTMSQLAMGLLRLGLLIDGAYTDGGGKNWTEGFGQKDRYDQMIDMITMIQKLFEALSFLNGFNQNSVRVFNDFVETDGNIQRLVDNLNKMIDGLGGLHDTSGINFDGIGIVRKLYEAINAALTDRNAELPMLDGTRIVDSIIAAIGLGESAIAFYVHDMVQKALNASENPGGSEGSGYTFNPGTALQFLNNPVNVNPDEYLGKYQELFYGKGGTAEHPKEDSMFGMFSGFSTNMDGIEFPDMTGKLKDSFSFKDENGNDIDMLGELKASIGSFQEELNSSSAFEITIIPTFDFQNLNSESLRQKLASYPIGMPLNFMSFGTVKIDTSELAGIVDSDGIKSRISSVTAAVQTSQAEIVNSVNSMSGKIGDLARAVSSLKLYLDTGILVGSITPLIDMELGRRADKADSTGVSSPFANPYSYKRQMPK